MTDQPDPHHPRALVEPVDHSVAPSDPQPPEPWVTLQRLPGGWPGRGFSASPSSAWATSSRTRAGSRARSRCALRFTSTWYRKPQLLLHLLPRHALVALIGLDPQRVLCVQV